MVKIMALFLAVVGPLGLTLGADSTLGQLQEPNAVASAAEPNDPNAVKTTGLVPTVDAVA